PYTNVHLNSTHGFHFFFFFSSRRRHTRFSRDWSSDVCSSDLSHLLQHAREDAITHIRKHEPKIKTRETGRRFIFAETLINKGPGDRKSVVVKHPFNLTGFHFHVLRDVRYS